MVLSDGTGEVGLSDGADLGGIVRWGILKWSCQTGQTEVELSDGAERDGNVRGRA